MEGCYAAEAKRLESEMQSELADLRYPKSSDNNVEGRFLEPYLQPRILDLDQAQERWLDYRDAECEWEAEIFRAGSLRVGPVARIAGLSCQIEMTRARISTLRSRSYWE